MTTPPNPFYGLAEFGRQLAETMRPFQEMSEQLALTIKQQVLEPIGAWSAGMAKYAVALKKRQLLDDSGWLPHATLPTSLIDQCGGDARQLSRSISEHYAENWPEVRSELSGRIDRFRVDDEAKETVREALAAYDQKLYRSVCRLLMPEIERVVRIELNDGAQEMFVGKLQKVAGELDLCDIEPSGFLGMMLFVRLREHLYAHVHTEEELKRMEADPIPNRHATVHGLVSYRTAQNALNTIFMTDYIFQVVTSVKALPETDKLSVA
jgi:hypothetical protein